MQQGLTTLVVLPTYNEVENVGVIVATLMAMPGLGVLIVDDDSPDGTGRLADELAQTYPERLEVLHRSGERGLGLSYRDGFLRAMSYGASLIVQMDADGSHDPALLPPIVEAAKSYDLVIGSRYVPGGRVVEWPLWRLLLSRWANRYVRFVARLTPRDCTSGFRCWRREALARIPLGGVKSEGYAFQVEMVFEAAEAGCRIVEVPIVFVERRRGTSKLSSSGLVESLVMPWRLLRRRSGPTSPPRNPTA